MSEAEQSVRLLVGAGCDVVRAGWHIYRSQSKEYVLLHFDRRSNMITDDEESFEDLDDAVKKFCRRAGLLRENETC